MNILHKVQLATLIVIIGSVSALVLVYFSESDSPVAVSDENSVVPIITTSDTLVISDSVTTDATFDLPEKWEEQYTENFEIDYTEKFD